MEDNELLTRINAAGAGTRTFLESRFMCVRSTHADYFESNNEFILDTDTNEILPKELFHGQNYKELVALSALPYAISSGKTGFIVEFVEKDVLENYLNPSEEAVIKMIRKKESLISKYNEL